MPGVRAPLWDLLASRIIAVESNATRGSPPIQARGDQTYDRGADPASVENIALNNHAGMALSRSRTSGGAEVDPVNLTLEDYAHQRSLIVERNLAFIRFRVGALAGSGFPA